VQFFFFFLIQRGASNERYQAETQRKIWTSQQNIHRRIEKRQKGWICSSTKRQHNKKETISTKLDLQRSTISHYKRYLLHRELKPKTSDHHRLAQHNNSSLLAEKDSRTQKLKDFLWNSNWTENQKWKLKERCKTFNLMLKNKHGFLCGDLNSRHQRHNCSDPWVP
jgi:hypothetical protein